MINGCNILIYEGGTAVAGTRDFTLNLGADAMEDSSPFSASARTYELDMKSWDVTVTRLVTAMKSTLLHVGGTYSMAFRVRGDVGDYVTGTVLCTEAQVEAAVDNLARGTWRFVGLGEITSASIGDYNIDFNSDFLIS